jgi:undecaprenyl diphosphate synthase
VQEKAEDKLKKKGIVLDRRILPKHVAISISGHKLWAQKHKQPMEKVCEQLFPHVNSLIEYQIKYEIPIITVYLLTAKVKESEQFSVLMDSLVTYFESMALNKLIFEHKVKVSIFGKWYNLPGRVIEPIKKIIDETKDYDNFFLNLCINYDGQEEIADACRLLAMKVQSGKLDPDSVTKDELRDNIYSSYFLPPDIMIKTGKSKSLNGFMLWDSVNTTIYFSDTLWLDFKEDDFIKALKYYQDSKSQQP